MAYPNPLDFARIPTSVLIAMDWRPYHFAVQPYHYLIRMTHIISMAGFFGAIVALDLRLLGWRRNVPLRAFADQVLVFVYVTFGVAVLSGCALFLYDPVHVGSHAYFGPKLLLTALGVSNAALFWRTGYLASLVESPPIPEKPAAYARAAGAMSLALWIAVLVCACLNVEAAPRVLLR
jgi:hypothetical protein